MADHLQSTNMDSIYENNDLSSNTKTVLRPIIMEVFIFVRSVGELEI